MSWQDLVFAVGSLIFAAALVPSLRSEHKPHMRSSLLTGSILVVYTATFGTLGLWYAAATDALVAALWFVLAWQVERA